MRNWDADIRPRLARLELTPEREAEIVEELSQHLDDRCRELISGGAEPEEAERITLASFRSSDMLARYMAPLKQSHRTPPPPPAAPTGSSLLDLWQDARYALRGFAKKPGFAAAAALTLALGTGATTAIFSVVYGVVLRPLPFQDPERLVTLRHHTALGTTGNNGPATFLTYREHQQAFDAIGAWDPAEVSVTGDGEPERVQALLVSASTLPLLGLQPAAGRFFGAEDDLPGQPLRVVLTHGYWQRRFAGDAGIVGRTVAIDGRPAEVIGILPPSFKFLRTKPAVVLPMPLNPAAPRGVSFGFQALARLKPGVTVEQASADMARMISLLPPSFARLALRPDIQPLSVEAVGEIGRVLWILFAAVAVVLFIACANVANLLLIRGEGRQQELALRAALGASRGRLARTLLAESVLLALIGAALGVLFAHGAIALLRAIAPAELPRVDEIAIDGTVLLFALGIAVASGLLFGLVAVIRFGHPAITTIRDGGRSASDAPSRHRTRNALVVGQVALALCLLIVSGLMLRTVMALRDVDPGFRNPAEVQTFVVAIPATAIAEPREAVQTHEAIAERVRQVPGVTSVGMSSSITMDGEDNMNYIAVEGFPDKDGDPVKLRRFKSFAPGYFETMGIRLAAGRSITWADVYEQRPVVVISAPLARQYWGEPAHAIGRRIRGSGAQAPWREIVGVTSDERDDGLSQPATPIVYWPMWSESYRWRTMSYAVRSTRAGTPGFTRELAQAVWAVNAQLPLAEIRTLEEIKSASMVQTSFTMTMLVIASAVALLIGVVGIYGVIAYMAAQRTREVGIRMALGAQIRDVRRLFLRHGLMLTGIGIALGVTIALVLTRVLSALLFGVERTDPATYATVSLAVAAIALIATYVPARRASAVDPVIAMRGDA